MRTSLLTALAAAFAVAAPGVAMAQLIAADGFNADDYEFDFAPGQDRVFQVIPGNPMAGTGPNADGNPVVTPGWVDDGDGDPSPWFGGTANLQWDTDEENPTLGSSVVGYDDGSTGKGTLVPIQTGGFGVDYRSSGRLLDPYAQADTYYMSFLLNPGGAFTTTTGARDRAMVGFTNSAWTNNGFNNVDTLAGNPFGLMVGFNGEDADSNPAAEDQVNLVIRARNGDLGDPSLVDTVLLAGDSENPLDSLTYLVMLKVDINVEGGSFDEVTYWVNPSNVATEQAAIDSALSTGTFNTLAFNAGSNAGLGTDFDRFQIAINAWEDRSFFFDEVRLAGDFESLRGEIPVSGIDGDYNNDGVVDAADYTVFRDALGQPVDLPNDTTPGTVSQPEDYDVWVDNYGADAPPGGEAIPEPAAAVLLLAGMAGLLGRRA